MTSLGKIAVICFVFAVGLVSCLKPQEFPPEPEISFKEFLIMSDSAKLTITFQDGDGDVGLNDADTLPPYDASSIYHFNLFAQYWEKDDALGWIQ